MSTTRPISRWEDVETTDPVANRKLLANLLLEVARCVDHEVAAKVPSALDADPRVEALRHILLEPEQAALAQLQQKFDDPRPVRRRGGRGAAGRHSPGRSRRTTGSAMRSPRWSRRATQTSIRKNPRTLINILAPLMGPAIRKSVAETLDGSLQSLNQALKHSLSWRGLKWRMEAYRTGTSFAEVVLRHTARLPRRACVSDPSQDRSHARTRGGGGRHHQGPAARVGHADCDPGFRARLVRRVARWGGIDTLRLGEFLLWCEEGPLAFLAAVIRGNPPESLHGVLRETLDAIHAEHRTALENFDGDVAAFADVRARLDRCLAQQAKSADAQRNHTAALG